MERERSPQVFYTHQWALAMQRAYGTHRIPFLVLQYDEGQLVGVASLATDSNARVASFLAGTTADYCDFLGAEQRRASLVEATFAELNKLGIQKIELANLPGDSSSVNALRSVAGKYNFRIFLRPAYQCAQIELANGEIRAQLATSIQRKNTFRRAIAKLEKAGPVTLRNLRTWHEIEPVLPEFFAAHVGRFLATGRISNVASGDRRVFLTELARLLSASGWMSVSELTVGTRSIAWNYGFQFAGSWFWYQPTFDTNYEPVSPGYCLLAKIVLDACNDPEMQRVDLGLGAEGYKERFANRARPTMHGTVTTSLSGHLRVAARYSLASTIARSPRFDELVRAARARLTAGQASGLPRLAGKAWKRARTTLWSRDEVVFYQWPPDASRKMQDARFESRLEPLDLNWLALGATHYWEDQETCLYLLRSAQRLRDNRARGFALLNSAGVPVHFCWADAFDGFFMAELATRLESGVPNAQLIFDCWTPRAHRGNGYYAVAIANLARLLVGEGRDPWIFSAESNRASMRGIDQAGFERRYSLMRRTTLGMRSLAKVSRPTASAAAVPVAG